MPSRSAVVRLLRRADMNTRLLALPLTLGAMLFALGCSSHVEMPVTAAAMPDEKPKGDVLPQAPMPRVKKTTAELLVGKWKKVEPVSGTTHTSEYTHDGKAVGTSSDRNGVRVRALEYRLIGTTLAFTPSDANYSSSPKHAQQRTSFVESVTEDKLVIVLVINGRWTLEGAREQAHIRDEPVERWLNETWVERHRSVYERIKGDK